MFADNNRKIIRYEKRFGVIAVEKGFITADDLVNALAVQVSEDCRHLPHRLLGEIFFHMGLMTDSEVEETVREIFIKAPDAASSK